MAFPGGAWERGLKIGASHGSRTRQSSVLLSFQGSALECTALEAPPHVSHAFTTQEAGASGAWRSQAEPGNEG